MSALGVLVIQYVQKVEVRSVLLGGKPYYLQLLTGLFFGSLSALLGVVLINGRRFRVLRTVLEEMINEVNPSVFDIVFYSTCAAVGEEVLFRAGLQPLLGVWPTALLFVLLHGYLQRITLSFILYNLFLLAICAGFGYLFHFFGLFSCMIAHFVYDVAMFCMLKYAYRSNTEAATVV